MSWISSCPRRSGTWTLPACLFLFLGGAAPARAQLVVNEIDYDQPGTDLAEFIEIKNVSASSVNLSSYSVELVDGNGGGAVVYQTIVLPAFNLAAGAYYVICANAANVINCNLDVTPDSNLIQNGSQDAVAIRQGPTLIDTVSYEGVTGAPYTEGGVGAPADDGLTPRAASPAFPTESTQTPTTWTSQSLPSPPASPTRCRWSCRASPWSRSNLRLRG